MNDRTSIANPQPNIFCSPPICSSTRLSDLEEDITPNANYFI